MDGCKVTRSNTAHKVVAFVGAAQVVMNQLPPPPPQGVTNQVAETPLHPDLLQALDIVRFVLVPQIRPSISSPTSQSETLPGFQLL